MSQVQSGLQASAYKNLRGEILENGINRTDC